MNKQVRVRFAPSPTGFMHLGNVRIALLNYMFAKKYQGAFILRIEDTDQQRNVDPGAQAIINNLSWLGLSYNEGPDKDGGYGPYFQSQRTHLYQQKLQELIDKQLVYRCFCTAEELEKKRQRQAALKLPPRYDRACMALTPQVIAKNLETSAPFIWRLKTTQEKEIAIADRAHGTIKFNLKDFSDTPLTRSDGSFTFVFANCVDDILMRISHVIRGEDHITNTASQVVIYESLAAEVPEFWHVPIMCNAQGKKLSKRDFGFSLNDLQGAGYLPEAILNYLGIIGGSFEKEILSLAELVAASTFDHLHAASSKYDPEKLRWVNHQWIARLTPEALLDLSMPLLQAAFPTASTTDRTVLIKLIRAAQSETVTLQDIPQVLHFYFARPLISPETLHACAADATVAAIKTILKDHVTLIAQQAQFLEQIKAVAKKQGITTKELLCVVRIMLTGYPQGLGISELLELLGSPESGQRIEAWL